MGMLRPLGSMGTLDRLVSELIEYRGLEMFYFLLSPSASRHTDEKEKTRINMKTKEAALGFRFWVLQSLIRCGDVDIEAVQRIKCRSVLECWMTGEVGATY